MNTNIKIRISKISSADKGKFKFILYALIIGLSVASSYPISNIKYYGNSLNNTLVSEQALLKAPFVYNFDPSVQNLITSKVEYVFARHVNFQYETELKREVNVSLSLEERFNLRKKIFSEELKINVSDEEYKILLENKFKECIPKIINLTITQILSGGVVLDKKIFLQELYRGVVLRNCGNIPMKQIEDVRTFYDFDQAKSMVSIIANSFYKELDPDLLELVINFSRRLIKPNVIFNVEETNRRKDSIVKLNLAEPYHAKYGEISPPIDCIRPVQSNSSKLKVFNNNSLLSIAGQVLILTFILLIYYKVQLKPKIKSKQLNNKDLTFLTVILLITMIIIKILDVFPDILYFNSDVYGHCCNTRFGLPVAAGSMIVCLVLGTETAFSFALLFAVIVSVPLSNKFEHCVYFFMSSVAAVWWVKDCRERRSIIKAGVKLGLFCVVISAMINIHMLQYFNWFYSLLDAVITFASGMSAGMIVVGVLPLVEMLFKYTTNSTLLELANLDRPILKKLMLEAPGTYHHSIVVGSMVEAAASEIGANSLLGKVCGYYHDIGKLKQPIYFVENQLDRRNKHDKLSPSMSSLVIISHVKHGIEIAKKHNLGNAIIDVIKQHHGNSLISYFFDKAKQIKGEENVNISDFRYPGPVPQTVEAGLVMLADVVEAASRTLVNPTSSRIKGLVHNLINKVFSDGQLSDCDLTLRDLNSIAKSFNNILSGIYHNRVEYKSSSCRVADGKLKNVDTNQKQSAPASTYTKDSQDSSNSLKRLGLS